MTTVCMVVHAEASERRAKDIRKEVALSMDLDTVADHCPSFQRFRQEILRISI